MFPQLHLLSQTSQIKIPVRLSFLCAAPAKHMRWITPRSTQTISLIGQVLSYPQLICDGSHAAPCAVHSLRGHGGGEPRGAPAISPSMSRSCRLMAFQCSPSAPSPPSRALPDKAPRLLRLIAETPNFGILYQVDWDMIYAVYRYNYWQLSSLCRYFLLSNADLLRKLTFYNQFHHFIVK